MTILQGSPTLHRRPGIRDGHTLELVIHSEALSFQWVCPHQGTAFDSIETAPACRVGVADDGIETVYQTCVPGEHFAELQAEAFHLDDDFPVSTMPMDVEWWFDGYGSDELYVCPYRPDLDSPVLGPAGTHQ